MNGIVLSYVGVHQIFQLALAAHEMGELEELHCSMIDHPGKWGASLARRLQIPSARPLGYEALPPGKVREFPWPVIMHRVAHRLLPWRRSDHSRSNQWFDRVIARRLRQSQAKIFAGVETCALESMQAARRQGMRCVLDCAGMPHQFLDEAERRAAAELNLPEPARTTSRAMEERKHEEWKLADRILCCSEFQAAEMVELGADGARIHVAPLWVDAAFWQDGGRAQRPRDAGPLRVLYAGGVSLRKGVPFLLQAMPLLGRKASLTLVGRPSPELEPMLANLPANISHRPYVPKEELRRTFHDHDVLVLPTLGDSFGFVAIEAMAAGLPVIVSGHAGVPVPDSDWRVRAASAEAIAERLRHYLENPEALAADGAIAAAFATQWTPERYRRQVAEVFGGLLAA